MMYKVIWVRNKAELKKLSNKELIQKSRETKKHVDEISKAAYRIIDEAERRLDDNTISNKEFCKV